jgi:hypothetical protein
MSVLVPFLRIHIMFSVPELSKSPWNVSEHLYHEWNIIMPDQIGSLANTWFSRPFRNRFIFLCDVEELASHSKTWLQTVRVPTLWMKSWLCFGRRRFFWRTIFFCGITAMGYRCGRSCSLISFLYHHYIGLDMGVLLLLEFRLRNNSPQRR